MNRDNKWIVEAAELKGMSKSDLDALKAYLSRRTKIEGKKVTP